MLNHTIYNSYSKYFKGAQSQWSCNIRKYCCAGASLFICLCLRVWERTRIVGAVSQQPRRVSIACLMEPIFPRKHCDSVVVDWLWISLHVTALQVACFPSSLWGPFLSWSILRATDKMANISVCTQANVTPCTYGIAGKLMRSLTIKVYLSQTQEWYRRFYFSIQQSCISWLILSDETLE